MLKYKLFILVLLPFLGWLTGALTSCQSASADQRDNEAMATSDSISVDSAKPDTIRFAFAGDIMMGTTYPETPKGAYLPPNDGNDLFCDVAEIFRSADVAAANLEGTLMDFGGTAHEEAPPELCYTFRMPPSYVRHLTDIGMDFMNVGNNHCFDFGMEGVESTHRILKEAGIAYAGYQSKCPSAIIERKGLKIGFAAFAHTRGTCSIYDYDYARKLVQHLDSICDLVVVSFHGGGEGVKFSHVPHKEEICFNGQRRGDVEKFAHAVIDAGADVVYGHGPHVVRAVEMYKDHLIIYSLGNFCTPFRMGVSGIRGYAPIVTVDLDHDGNFLGARIHSFIQEAGIGPRCDSKNIVADEIRRLTESDFPNTPIEIADDGTITKK